jgi:hypothetical protein
MAPYASLGTFFATATTPPPLTIGNFMSKRVLLKSLTAAATLAMMGLAQAQTTPIKFQLDWRFEGPAALFLTPAAKGYFKDAKLDVTIDAGNGSGGTVTRVASGAYDMGFADLAALMEFHANNPDAPTKPVAIMMVYNDTPASVMALKKSGIKSPADLAGKKLGAGEDEFRHLKGAAQPLPQQDDTDQQDPGGPIFYLFFAHDRLLLVDDLSLIHI